MGCGERHTHEISYVGSELGVCPEGERRVCRNEQTGQESASLVLEQPVPRSAVHGTSKIQWEREFQPEAQRPDQEKEDLSLSGKQDLSDSDAIMNEMQTAEPLEGVVDRAYVRQCNTVEKLVVSQPATSQWN